jgi:dTDP-4-dehydrorhamnose 3,5-epimerase-like enzyme
MKLKMQNNSIIIEGGFFEDQRGRIDFVNNFDASEIKRMYFTKNKEVNIFRGWQGHKIESRWFFCVAGKFEVKILKIDNWENPSKSLIPQTFILNEFKPQVLYVPKGYLNGFSSLEENSRLMVLSNYKLGENPDDDIRFESNKWQ